MTIHTKGDNRIRMWIFFYIIDLGPGHINASPKAKQTVAIFVQCALY